MLRALVATALAVIVLASLVLSAQGRDDGRYAQSPLKGWFDSLRGQHGMSCCSNADGMRLDDPDWEFSGEEYRVKIDGDWIAVPPDALVKQQNRVGYAIVWPWKDFAGKTQIRCFMPGSGT